jgi:hypothetical protein
MSSHDHSIQFAAYLGATIALSYAFFGAWWRKIRLEPTYLIWIGMVGTVCSVLILGAGVIWQAQPRVPLASVEEKPASLAKAALGPLSPEEIRFRQDLRKFVLSNAAEINQSFGYASATSDLTNEIYNNRSPLSPVERDKMLIVIDMYNGLLASEFFSTVKVVFDVANKPAEDIDVPKLADSLKAFFDGYRKAQGSFRSFLKLSGMDPKRNDALANWLSADARALNALRDLKSFPQAKLLDVIDEGYFSTRTGAFANYLVSPAGHK